MSSEFLPHSVNPDPHDMPPVEDKKRRDFLILATTAVGGVGAASFMWPFINSFNPAADTKAGATVDIDISQVHIGQAITVMWRGKPLFVRRRTPVEIKEAQAVDINSLRDPQSDQVRVKKPEWLVVVGVCTHLGCVPIGQKTTENRGKYGGYFCPCHGSTYDTSGRIRLGPAPTNLVVPPYTFLNDKTLRIGQDKA